MKLLSLIFLSLFFLAWIEANSSSGDRLLVVLEDASLKVSHSKFFSSLQERGFKVTFATVKDNSAVLQKYGEYLYDHLALFVSGVDDFAPKISVSSVVEFIDSGRNVLVVTDSEVGDAVRELGSEVGVEVEDENSFVIDHFNFHPDDSIDHTLIQAQAANVAPVFGTTPSNPVLFRGVGHVLVEENNGLNVPFLSGFPTSYSFQLDKQIGKRTPKALGRKTQLVSALQARNNARVVFSGSTDLFSDKLFNAEAVVNGKRVASGNQVFATRVSEWVFKERGVLKVNSVHHSLVGSDSTPSAYTIKDTMHYSIKISEWNGKAWAPFHAKDVQFEYTRLDPHVRAYLTPDTNGNFNITLLLPDVYGVFSFVVDYARPGYTFIKTKDVVPIRPFRHNQYERFIVAAYPYYASAFSMLGGLFVFSIAFLYTRDSKPKKD